MRMIHEIFEYCITYIRYAETDSAAKLQTIKNEPYSKTHKVHISITKF